MKKTSLTALTIALFILAGCSVNQPVSLLVNDITGKAIVAKDKSICESLQDAESRTLCINMVNDSAQADVALATGDSKACATILNQEYKKACELATTSVERANQRESEENNKLQKAQNGASLVACDELESDQAKDQCRIAVLSKMAYEQGDEKICLQIGREGARKMCQISLGVDVQ